MKDNRDNKAIIIPVDDIREDLQEFTDEELGGIVRALFESREQDFKDRAMRIVYRKLRAANERINATYEAKRERFKKAAEARWQKDGNEPQESEREEAEIEQKNAVKTEENSEEKGKKTTHKMQSDAMQRNATHSDALKCNAIPNQTIPYQTKPRKESDREKTAAHGGTHSPDFSEKKQKREADPSGDRQSQTSPGTSEQPPDGTDWRKYWNDRAADSDIPHIGMTPKRSERIQQLTKQFGAESIRAVIDYVTGSRRLSRRNGKSNFRATFDWVTGEAFQQLLEEALQERRESLRKKQEAEEELRHNPPAPKPKSRRETLAGWIDAVKNGSKSPSIIAILRVARESGELKELGLAWDG